MHAFKKAVGIVSIVVLDVIFAAPIERGKLLS